jgi:D-3-phosphoglycerate dehydrogenase / 2-oxoglutarate reductase
MSSQKVIITAPAHPILQQKLTELGCAVVVHEGITYTDLLNTAHQYTGMVVVTSVLVDAPLLDQATQLKWIARLGSGLEGIDVNYAKSKNITVVNSPEGNRLAVAEQALGMLLSLMHNIQRSAIQVQQGLWLRNPNRGLELSSKTVGIIGYGNTGAEFAKLLASFNVTVLAHDRSKKGFSSGYVQEASVSEIQKNAHVISFHVSLNESSLYMANHSFFEALQQKPYILNTSRGKVIKLNALLDALNQNLISGAALDVIETEPLEKNTPEEISVLAQLQAHPNCFITPHIAGYTHESFLKMAEVLFDKIKNIK